MVFQQGHENDGVSSLAICGKNIPKEKLGKPL